MGREGGQEQVSEHGDVHGANLNIWGPECVKGDPTPRASAESRANGRLGGRCGGRPRGVLPQEVGRYRLIEEVVERYGERKRLVVRVQCGCGLSPPRTIQRADWMRPDMAQACRACRSEWARMCRDGEVAP